MTPPNCVCGGKPVHVPIPKTDDSDVMHRIECSLCDKQTPEFYHFRNALDAWKRCHAWVAYALRKVPTQEPAFDPWEHLP